MELFESKKETGILLAISAVLGILFDVLFYNAYTLGLNYLLFALLLLGATFWALAHKKEFDPKRYALFSVAIILLAGECTVYASPVFMALNFFVVPFLYFCMVLSALHVETDLFNNFFGYVFIPISRMHRFFASLVGLFGVKRGEKHTAGKVLLGVAIAAAALVIILPLMLSADEAFRYLMRDVFDFHINADFFVQTILFLLVACYGFGFVHYALTGKKQPMYEPQFPGNAQQNGMPYGQPQYANQANPYDYPPPTYPKAKPEANHYASTLVTFLSIIGIVYAVFSFVQILYLFLKIGAGLPSGFSYAQYARAGVFQLWALTAISVAVVLICESLGRKMTAVKQRTLQWIYTGYVIMTLCMTASSVYRMVMYAEAFGMTRARTLVFFYLILQTILLVMLMGKVWNPKFRFYRTLLAVTLAFYVMLNYANIDDIVVEMNLSLYYNTGELDVDYIMNDLSVDALPYLYYYGQDNMKYDPETVYTEPQRQDYAIEKAYIQALYRYELQQFINRTDHEQYRYEWRDFSFSMHRAVNLVNGI